MRQYIDSETNVNKLGISPDTKYNMMILNICDENGSIPENRDIFIDRNILSQKYENKYGMLDNITGVDIIQIINDDCIGDIEITSRSFGIISDFTLNREDVKVLSKTESDKSVTLQCKLNKISCEFEFNFFIISIIEDGYYYPISTMHIHPEKAKPLKNFEINYTLEF